MSPQDTWPALPLDQWKDTYATLHMYTQVVGKVRLKLSPMMNQWWQVPLYLSARGLTTSPIAYHDRTFEMEFDFHQHSLVVTTCEGTTHRLALGGPVRDFYRKVMRMLLDLGIDIRIRPHPAEVPNPIPFEEDVEHHTYDPAQVERFWHVLRRVDTVFRQFRSRFTGKCSPVHFFWGSFDLAVTRFSGRPATPKPGSDLITRVAYNEELSSLGFWPGGPVIPGPAFYSYSFPEPSGFRQQPVRPAAAGYNEKMGEFLLMYDDVRGEPDPRAAILEFAQTTFEAGARLQNWPPPLLERQPEDPVTAGATG